MVKVQKVERYQQRAEDKDGSLFMIPVSMCFCELFLNNESGWSWIYRRRRLGMDEGSSFFSCLLERVIWQLPYVGQNTELWLVFVCWDGGSAVETN